MDTASFPSSNKLFNLSWYVNPDAIMISVLAWKASGPEFKSQSKGEQKFLEISMYAYYRYCI